MKENRVSTTLAILSFFVVLGPLAGIIYWQWNKMTEEFNRPGYELTLKKSSEISAEEKMEIDLWIKDNNLNQYSDPKDTVYTGGTPLFDEKTGQRIDRYEYILKKHPNRPWQK